MLTLKMDFKNNNSTECSESAVAYILSTDNRAQQSIAGQFLDRHVNWKVTDKISLYGVFSGHYGDSVAEASKEIMTNYLTKKLNDTSTDYEVRSYLSHAFREAEGNYFASRNQIHDPLNNKQDQMIGCSVILCLKFDRKMFISNVGACRALLCKYDENKKPTVVQYSVDHNIYNEEELNRLESLQLKSFNFSKWEIPFTRCIGSIAVKNLYKEIPYLKNAKSMPIIAEEEIVGPIEIEDSFQYLLILSSGLCKALKDVISENVTLQNREIIRIAEEEFKKQMTIEDVAKNIIDKIMNKYPTRTNSTAKHDEVRLIVRKFFVDMPQCNKQLLQDTITPATTEDTTKLTKNLKAPDYVDPYVNFSSYYENVEEARKAGKLPDGIDFD